MNLRLLFTLVFAFFISTIFCQNQLYKNVQTYDCPVSFDLLKPNKDNSKIDFQQHVHSIQAFDLDASMHQAIFKSRPEFLEIPILIDEEELVLNLYSVNIFGDNYLLETSSGDKPKYQATGAFYHGVIQGDQNSTIALSIFSDDLRFLISNAKGNFEISKNGDSYVGYYDEHIKRKNEIRCHFTSNLGNRNEDEDENDELKSSSTGGCIEVYFECDNRSYIDNGNSVTNTENWATALFNEISMIYSNESVPISLSSMLVWNTSDPYTSFNSTSAVLREFGNVRRNNYTGRLAHLLTTRSLGGGIAWLDVLCNTYGGGNSHFGPYAVSANLSTNVVAFPTYSWSVNVIAHELGHNIGSQHTHDCVWGPNGNEQIDDCGPEYFNISNPSCYDPANPILPSSGGTTMSYCHGGSLGINLSNGFGTEPGDLIRDEFNNASCSTGTSCPSGLTITCPAPYFGAYNCNASSYDPIVTGEPTTSGGTGAITLSYTDQFTQMTNCLVEIERSWTATDANASTADCAQYIFVQDNMAPIPLNCPADITLAANSTCFAQAFWVEPNFTDNCGAPNVISNFNSGDLFQIGTTNVVYTAIDNCGNIGNCSFDVIVSVGACGACPDFIDENRNPIPDGLYKAADQVNSAGVVPVGGTVFFEAGVEINLNNNFEVQAGASFDATIAPCILLDEEEDPTGNK